MKNRILSVENNWLKSEENYHADNFVENVVYKYSEKLVKFVSTIMQIFWIEYIFYNGKITKNQLFE